MGCPPPPEPGPGPGEGAARRPNGPRGPRIRPRLPPTREPRRGAQLPGSMAQQDSEQGPQVLGIPEQECQICYSCYDTHTRRPKMLPCSHRLCARCLRKMVALGDASPHQLRCPFCRQQSPVPGGDVQQLQDDGQALALLMGHEWAMKQGPPRSPEVLLCPSVLQPASGPDCLVVTILEVPEDASPPEGLGGLEVVGLYRPTSLSSLPCYGPRQKCRSWGWRAAPRCILGVLGLLYFSSLPFGIYLLLIEHHGLGIVLVSLVPSTLLLCIVYSLCRCLCWEVFRFSHS